MASDLAMKAGADFIKTPRVDCTAATMPVVLVMLHAIQITIILQGLK